MRSLIRILNLTLLAALITVSAVPAAAELRNTAPRYNWLQFDGDPQHSGNNRWETSITPANVNQLSQLYQTPLPAVADGAPAYLSVATAQGIKFLLFLTTTDGSILALDALTGATAWSHQYGPGSCMINNGSNVCYTTSSPAVDPNLQNVYSYGLDGFVHKYQAANGNEVKTGGWPELATLKNFDEKGSSALSVATAANGTSYLYVANGGYPGDNGDYQGHITAINLSDGSQKVFNANCSNQTVHFVEMPGTPDCPALQTAIWARPGVVYDPDTDRIYMSTGNGDFVPASHDWGDTAFALHPDGTGGPGGNPLDSYTPTNFASLQAGDVDLGSTAPVLLPTLPGANAKNQHVAVQSGKDARLRLINLDNMSGQGGTGHTGGEIGAIANVPQGGEVLTTPAVWVNPANGVPWIFIANGNGVSGLPVGLDASGNDKFGTGWQVGGGATSPLVANGMVFVAGGGMIRALNPLNGQTLWSSTGIGPIHWESPVVDNGVLYITDGNGNLTAFSIGGIKPDLVDTVYSPLIIK
jgi:hypothetical protein